MTLCKYHLVISFIFVISILSNAEDQNGRDYLTLPPTTTTKHITKSPSIVNTGKPCEHADSDGCQPYISRTTSPISHSEIFNGRNNITLTPTTSTTNSPTKIPTSFTNDGDNSKPPTPGPFILIQVTESDGRNTGATQTPTQSIQPIASPTEYGNDKDPVPTYIPTLEPTVNPTINPTLNPVIYTAINTIIFNTTIAKNMGVTYDKNTDSSNASVVIISVFILIIVLALICCLTCYFLGRGAAKKTSSIEMEMKTQIDIKMDADIQTTHIHLETQENTSNTVVVESAINAIIKVNTPGEEIDLMEEIIMSVVVDNIEQNMEQTENKEEGKMTAESTVVVINNNAHSPMRDNMDIKEEFPDINVVDNNNSNVTKVGKAYPMNMNNNNTQRDDIDVNMTKKGLAYPADVDYTKGNDIDVNETKKGKAYPMNDKITKRDNISSNMTKNGKAYPMNMNGNNNTKTDDISLNITKNGKACPMNIDDTKRNDIDVNVTKKDKAYPMNDKITKSDKVYPMDMSETKGKYITKSDKAYPMHMDNNNTKCDDNHKETKGMDMAMPMVTDKGNDVDVVNNKD